MLFGAVRTGLGQQNRLPRHVRQKRHTAAVQGTAGIIAAMALKATILEAEREVSLSLDLFPVLSPYLTNPHGRRKPMNCNFPNRYFGARIGPRAWEATQCVGFVFCWLP